MCYIVLLDSVKSEVKQDTQILEGDQSNMHYEEEEEDEESSDDSRETHEPTDSSGDEMPTVTEHENEMHDVLQVLKSVTCPPGISLIFLFISLNYFYFKFCFLRTIHSCYVSHAGYIRED